MKLKENYLEIQPESVRNLLKKYYLPLISSFYEMQSSFLSGIYARYKSVETGNIVLCFARNSHLEIIRQRENNLNHNVSLENFWQNLLNINRPKEKISSIVEITNIPKETVRRKIKKLLSEGYLIHDKELKKYSWNLLPKHKEDYFELINKEIKILSKFLIKFVNHLNLNISLKSVEEELYNNFSFYWYHYLNCQINFLQHFQKKLSDTDLLLIVLQAVIPTLQHADKKSADFNVDNMFKIIGAVNNKSNFNKITVSTASISEVTGIPRPTCIRKLEKLKDLGFLMREEKSKRYFVNQNFSDRTKNILTRENVLHTVENFSTFLTIILNSLVYNSK